MKRKQDDDDAAEPYYRGGNSSATSPFKKYKGKAPDGEKRLRRFTKPFAVTNLPSQSR